MNKHDKYIEILKKNNLKNTNQRCAVLELIDSKDLPLTVEEIYFLLLKIKVSISISTVFRILETFVENGIVLKILGGKDNRTLYEFKRVQHRHYFYCVSCKAMIAIDSCPIKNFEKNIKDTLKCQITGHKFELSGYCEHCIPS